jgi:hypothetical protein
MPSLKHHLRPLHHLTRFFGVFHFTLHQTPTTKISTRILDQFCSVPYFVYHIVLISLGIDSFYHHQLSKSHKSNYALKEITVATTCFLKINIDYFWFIAKRHQIRKILNELDIICRQLPIKFNPGIIKFQASAIFFTTSVAWIVLSVVNFKNNFNMLLTWMSEILIFMGVINYVMYTLTKIIKKLFSLTNEDLNELNLMTSPDEATAFIKKCTQTHFQLAELSRRLNSIFSIPLLGNALILFFLIIFVTYHIVLRLHHPEVTPYENYHILKGFFSLILLALQLTFMVYSWDSITKEVSRNVII